MLELKSNGERILEFIKHHPDIGLRVRTMIDVMDNVNGDMTVIHDVDERMVEELRKLGHVAIETWAEEREKDTEQAARCNPTMTFERKKKPRVTRWPAAK